VITRTKNIIIHTVHRHSRYTMTTQLTKTNDYTLNSQSKD